MYIHMHIDVCLHIYVHMHMYTCSNAVKHTCKHSVHSRRCLSAPSPFHCSSDIKWWKHHILKTALGHRLLVQKLHVRLAAVPAIGTSCHTNAP